MKKIKWHVLLTFLLFGLLGCHNNQMKKIEREEEVNIYLAEDNDEEMNIAIKTAKQTLEKFNNALNSKNNEFDSFFLKVCFENKEHIWIGNITIKNNEYYGTVNNIPEYVENIHLGDFIKINKNNITDWMYTDNKKLVGGFTLRLIRNRMSEDEKKQFDSESQLIFDE